MSRRVLLLAAALLALGCGKSKERELFEQRRSVCGTLVGKTVLQAEQLLVGSAKAESCPASSPPPIAGDTCPGAPAAYTEPICIQEFVYLPNDPGLCSPQGCFYGCLTRTTAADRTNAGTGAVICAAQFFDGNPVPPF
ncbi:MAG TPA: hypothetical protein VFP50_05145 [Anaeromyxobacteraceae bacterium]|nr:hypothetical protein [Anaeromyxobacteraceae bacterium]